jgi:hypothetical protein
MREQSQLDPAEGAEDGGSNMLWPLYRFFAFITKNPEDSRQERAFRHRSNSAMRFPIRVVKSR